MRQSAAVLLASYVLGAWLAACSPSPAPVHPDASPDGAAPFVPSAACGVADGDVYAVACCHLAALGCAEGTHPQCAASMRRSGPMLGVVFDVNCIIAAGSKVAVRDCGGGVISCH